MGGNRNGRTNPQQGENNSNFQDEIANGRVPGSAGKDYPVNSLAALRKKFPGLGLAPDELIVPGYPLGNLPRRNKGNRNSGGNRNGNRTNGGNRNGGNRRNQNQNRPTSSTASESYCAGGSLQECIRFCPSDESGSEFSTCVTDCGNQCPN